MAIPSFDDLYDTGKAEMLLKRPDLFLNEGDLTDFLIAMAAAMADKNVQYATEEARKTFLDTASGDDLTTLCDDHWGVQRQDAAAATVTLSFSRSAGALPGGTISAGTTVATVEDASGDRQEFTTDSDVVWSASESGTKTVAATASSTGRDGNVGDNEITVIVTSLFDSNLTVNNTAAAAGGADEETDDALRERTRAFPSTLRRGTKDALEYGAKQVAGVSVATVAEDPDTGLVTVYVSDADGNSTTQMATDVATELESWRAAGSVVQVLGGSVYTQNITVALTVKAGTDIDALVTDIDAALDARLAKLDIGETLYRSIIRTTIMNVRIDKIVEVTVTTPAADVAPAANEVIRMGTLTVS